MTNADTKKLQARMRWAEARMEFMRALHELMPAFQDQALKWNSSIAKTIKRSRGERGKLNGGILVEQMIVDLVKTRKILLHDDGHSTFDAWAQAREEVGKVTGFSAATLEDWQRGARRRERTKQIEKRRFRRKPLKKSD